MKTPRIQVPVIWPFLSLSRNGPSKDSAKQLDRRRRCNLSTPNVDLKVRPAHPSTSLRDDSEVPIAIHDPGEIGQGLPPRPPQLFRSEEIVMGHVLRHGPKFLCVPPTLLDTNKGICDFLEETVSVFCRQGSSASLRPHPGHFKNKHSLGSLDEEEWEQPSRRRLCLVRAQFAPSHPRSVLSADWLHVSAERLRKETNRRTRPQLRHPDHVNVVGMLDSRSTVVASDFEVAIAVHYPRQVREVISRVHNARND